MSNPEEVKPCALVLGHSFVRRLKAFSNKNRSSRNLNLEDTCRVFLSGIGGRTVDKLIQFDLAKLHVLQPNVVVLEIGSNDLCDISSDPETIGSTIITLIDSLRVEFSVDWVVVCQILPRKNQPYPEYNSARSSLNSWLKNTLSTTEHATFWRHRGLARPSLNIFDVDGIHLNRRGQQRLFRSYRGAILFAIKQLQP